MYLEDIHSFMRLEKRVIFNISRKRNHSHDSTNGERPALTGKEIDEVYMVGRKLEGEAHFVVLAANRPKNGRLFMQSRRFHELKKDIKIHLRNAWRCVLHRCNRGFILGGECYTHGIMEGEAMSTKNTVTRNFMLV